MNATMVWETLSVRREAYRHAVAWSPVTASPARSRRVSRS